MLKDPIHGIAFWIGAIVAFVCWLLGAKKYYERKTQV